MALWLKPCFFKGAGAGSDLERRNHFLRDMARATSAAPTCFEPAKICTAGGSMIRYLVDGGVFAGNPACAPAPEPRGSGNLRMTLLSRVWEPAPGPAPPNTGRRKTRGMARWAKPVMDVMTDGAADAVLRRLEHMLPEDRYYRFNTCLRACDKMDDASGADINALKRDARRIVDGRETSAELDALCAKLVA